MRLAIITGTSRGLGLSIAREFASHGWQVIGTGRSERSAELPDDITYHQFDAGDAAAGASFWHQVKQQYADAEVCLVNNAGGYVSGGLLDIGPEDYEEQMRSCFFAAVHMTRGLAQSFETARIVNVISTSGLAPHKNNPAYGAAKAAERHFFQSLQQEFKPARYQIINLYPSDIASWGPNPKAIDAQELAAFIRDQAESELSYYLRDVTLYPRG